jgi:hypothetical protein
MPVVSTEVDTMPDLCTELGTFPFVCTEVGTMPFVCTEVGTKCACSVYRDYITEITSAEIQILPPGPVFKRETDR